MSDRKNIRHAVCETLKAEASLTDRVHASRQYPLLGDKPGVLPAILVYTDRDPADKVNSFQSARTLGLRIVVIVRADEDADDTLDIFCELIESLIESATDGTALVQTALDALIEECTYLDTILSYTGEDGRADFVHAEMTYSLRYIRTPQQSFDDLKEAVARFDMSSPRNNPPLPIGPDGQIDATATITFPT